MQSRVRVAGHPLHPMLVSFPLAAFPILFVFDVLYYFLVEPAFFVAGFWLAVAALVMGVLAAVPGVADLAAVPQAARAHRTAFWHAATGGLLLVLFAAAAWARWPTGLAADRFVLVGFVDAAGVAVAIVQGWLGGALVYKHHLAVLTREEGADPTPFTSSEERRVSGGAARRRGASRP